MSSPDTLDARVCDFDGDGKADAAVYRFTTLTFYVLRSSDTGVQAATFGVSGNDYMLPADFDGDGKTDGCDVT